MSYGNDELSQETVNLAIRAAHEGIPVGAIARVIQHPFMDVSEALRRAMGSGRIVTMPKPDWPPSGKWDNRVPSVQRSADVEFYVKQLFKLTKLEAGFMAVLMRYDCATKDTLHGVVEEQRAHRSLRPDKQETTDPKMVDVIVCKLRKKLKDVDSTLVLNTSWGHGYYFETAVKQKICTMIGEMNGDGPSAERAGTAGSTAQPS